MRINFLFPGKTKESFLAEGVAFYLKRLGHMVEAREFILKSPAPPGEGPAAEALARSRETSIILERCGVGDFLIVSDIQGKTMGSVELAEKFDQLQLSGTKVVNIIVGGPWGIDASLLSKANLRLSLGPMTFPHELARVMVLEQIYRAYTILNHIPYHK